MRGPRKTGAPRCANFKIVCDPMRGGQRTFCQKSAPKRKRSHISGSFLTWASAADASQPLGSRGEGCLVHHDFVQRSKIRRADDARHLGGSVTSCLRDLLVRPKRIFQDREQDPIVPTMVTGIGALWHCSTSLPIFHCFHSPTAPSMLQIVFKGWLACVLVIPNVPCVIERWLADRVFDPADATCEDDLTGKRGTIRE
jgi:hypothetical protein